jgi:hypothetical protein
MLFAPSGMVGSVRQSLVIAAFYKGRLRSDIHYIHAFMSEMGRLMSFLFNFVAN